MDRKQQAYQAGIDFVIAEIELRRRSKAQRGLDFAVTHTLVWYIYDQMRDNIARMVYERKIKGPTLYYFIGAWQACSMLSLQLISFGNGQLYSRLAEPWKGSLRDTRMPSNILTEGRLEFTSITPPVDGFIEQAERFNAGLFKALDYLLSNPLSDLTLQSITVDAAVACETLMVEAQQESNFQLSPIARARVQEYIAGTLAAFVPLKRRAAQAGAPMPVTVELLTSWEADLQALMIDLPASQDSLESRLPDQRQILVELNELTAQNPNSQRLLKLGPVDLLGTGIEVEARLIVWAERLSSQFETPPGCTGEYGLVIDTTESYGIIIYFNSENTHGR